MKDLLFVTLSLFIISTSLSQAPKNGSIVGKLTDREMNGEPLPFANVIIKGTSTGTTSDYNGLYILDKIEPGTYTVAFSFVGYETIEVPNVRVEAGNVTEVNTELGSSAASLDEVVISTVARRDSEVALLMEQKNSVEIKESIGAQELARKAVNNVEQGVSKISGVSMVQDRGVFVRGLDDRYNYLLVNGLPLASSDPDFKIIPLSYISTNIISNVNVFKTFSPNLYQDFAGATFNLQTKSGAGPNQSQFSIGVNYNTNSTFEDFYMDDSSGSEFLGYTGDGRQLPDVYDQGSLGYTATPSESSELFETSWTPKKSTAPLDTRIGFSHNQKIFKNENNELGVFFSLNFRNSYQKRNGVERTLNSEGTAGQDFQSVNYEYTTQKSALLNFNYENGDLLNLNFNTIYQQNSSNFIREAYGRNDGFTQLNNRDFFIRDTRYTENDLLNFQLLGDLNFQESKHQIHFGGSFGLGNNKVPDRRVLRAAGVGEDATYITTNGINPFKFYQELENYNFNGVLDYKLGLGKKDEDLDKYRTSITAGYNFDLIQYDFFNRIITAQVNTNDLPNLNTNDPEAFFETGFEEGFLRYSSTFDPTERSRIDQMINAGYLSFLQEWDDLILEAGIRAEYTIREIAFREPFDRPETNYQKQTYNPFNLSPSLNLKYEVTEKANLRLTSSITNTRPRLREILPTIYQDGDGNQVIGNPDLINSTNYNLDLKYEVFPTSSQVFALTAFGKYLENPIERLARSTSVGYRTFFDNFQEAFIYGLELEARFNFGKILQNDHMERLAFGFNGILMDSEASANPDNPRFTVVTNKTRKLQGASNWGINADLSYDIIDNENTESTVNLIFNTYGRRIYAVGVEGADEIYEKPINQLDFTWNTEFNDTWGLRLTVRNILNEKTLFTQDPTQSIRFPERFSNVVENFDQGVSIGASLTYSF